MPPPPPAPDDRPEPARDPRLAGAGPETTADAVAAADQMSGNVAIAEAQGAPAAPADIPSAPARKFSLGNRPPLTGVRAFLIVAILTFHSNFRTFPGAWAAMAVFFALSGFLITAMLVGEREKKGTINLRHFYARRAVRLLPPLFITVGLLALYAAFVFVPFAKERLWGDVSAAVFYYADFRAGSGHEPLLGFLSQTWSLSLEEQFYVIWAILTVVALALGRRSLAYVFATVGVVASASVRLWFVLGADHYSTALFTRIYYSFDTRADALFVGCLLGLLATGGHLNNWNRRAKQALGVAALASVAVLVWIGCNVPLGDRAVLVWWMPINELASVVLVAYFIVCPTGLGSRFAGLGLFVFIGDMTYTLYLVHWPVYTALNGLTTHWSYWPLEITRLVIIFGIALLSWFLVERPLMRWRRRALA